MKNLILGIVGILAVIIILGSLKSAPVDPASFTPPKPQKLSGVMSPNKLLLNAELLGLGKISGPEEVAVDSEGRVYWGEKNGKIKRLLAGGTIETFAEPKGHALGMKFDANQNLIVCDAHKGLLSISPQGDISVLSTSSNGVPFKFTDALDIASNGIIYFTDASTQYEQSEYLYDLLEAKPYGRLLSYNPATRETRTLLKDLYFANGVALSEQEDFVLINETYQYRIARYWLKGDKAGTNDIFIENLPGFPDNITSNGKGQFWLALFTVRNKIVDSIHPYPFLKKHLSKLPKILWPKPKPYGLVVALNEQGQITESLQDPTGNHLKEITSAREHKGYLYLGSLNNDRIGKYKLPSNAD